MKMTKAHVVVLAVFFLMVGGIGGAVFFGGASPPNEPEPVPKAPPDTTLSPDTRELDRLKALNEALEAENARLRREREALAAEYAQLRESWEAALEQRNQVERELAEINREIDTLNEEIVLSYGTVAEAARNSGSILRDMRSLFQEIRRYRQNDEPIPPELRERMRAMRPQVLEIMPLLSEATAMNDDPEQFAEFQSNFFGGLLDLDTAQTAQVADLMYSSRTQVIGLERDSDAYQTAQAQLNDQLQTVFSEEQAEAYQEVMERLGDPLRISSPAEMMGRRGGPGRGGPGRE